MKGASLSGHAIKNRSLKKKVANWSVLQNDTKRQGQLHAAGRLVQVPNTRNILIFLRAFIYKNARRVGADWSDQFIAISRVSNKRQLRLKTKSPRYPQQPVG